MGKVENGSNVSGKIGPVVYYTRNGKQFVRSAPVLASKRTRKRKETLPQKMTRMRFKWAFHMIGQIRQHIDELYQEIKGNGSPFHNAVGRIVKQLYEETSLKHYNSILRCFLLLMEVSFFLHVFKSS